MSLGIQNDGVMDELIGPQEVAPETVDVVMLCLCEGDDGGGVISEDVAQVYDTCVHSPSVKGDECEALWVSRR